MKKRFFALFLAALLAGCALKKPESEPEPENPLGLCGSIDGKTVIVTLFCSDYNTVFDPEDPEDLEKTERAREYLGIAVDFITEQTAKYGAETEFFWDWEEDPELMLYRNIPAEGMSSSDSFYWTLRILNQTVDTEELLEKYGADNIAYLTVFDSTDEFYGNIQAYNSVKSNFSDDPHEFVCMCFYNGEAKQETGPAAYAHELLHLFSVPDLYEAASPYGITEEYVEYVKEAYPNEIMLHTRDENDRYTYDRIDKEISEITAYYLGLTDSCGDVERFGLGASDFTEHLGEEE